MQNCLNYTTSLSEDFPLQFQIADGLDGSGSHAVYSLQPRIEILSHLSYYYLRLYRLEAVVINYPWKNNCPNSPYALCPIYLLAAKENESNIMQFMTDLVNPDTDLMKTEGFTLENGYQVHVDIV